MNRTEKTAEVEGLKKRFAASQLTIVTDYKGLTVSAVTDLRSKLRAKQTTLKVLKNRLAKIAVKDTPLEPLAAHFKGTRAVATLESSDLAGPAKVLTDFAKENEKLVLIAGFLEGKVLSSNEIKALANMPSREELIAKMLGSLQAPATNLVRVLSQLPRQVVQVLAAVRDQKEKSAS